MGSHGLVFPMIGSSGLVPPVMMVLTGVVDFASEDEEGDVVAVGLFVVVGVDDDVAGEDVLDGEAAEFLAAVDVGVGVPFANSDRVPRTFLLLREIFGNVTQIHLQLVVFGFGQSTMSRCQNNSATNNRSCARVLNLSSPHIWKPKFTNFFSKRGRNLLLNPILTTQGYAPIPS